MHRGGLGGRRIWRRRCVRRNRCWRWVQLDLVQGDDLLAGLDVAEVQVGRAAIQALGGLPIVRHTQRRKMQVQVLAWFAFGRCRFQVHGRNVPVPVKRGQVHGDAVCEQRGEQRLELLHATAPPAIAGHGDCRMSLAENVADKGGEVCAGADLDEHANAVVDKPAHGVGEAHRRGPLRAGQIAYGFRFFRERRRGRAAVDLGNAWSHVGVRIELAEGLGDRLEPGGVIGAAERQHCAHGATGS